MPFLCTCSKPAGSPLLGAIHAALQTDGDRLAEAADGVALGDGELRRALADAVAVHAAILELHLRTDHEILPRLVAARAVDDRYGLDGVYHLHSQ